MISARSISQMNLRSSTNNFRWPSLAWLLLVSVLWMSNTNKCMASDVLDKNYNIRFEHSLSNTASAPATNLRVFIAVPSSCTWQSITDLKPLSERFPKPTLSEDQYGQAVYIFDVQQLNPGETVNLGYSCTAKFKDSDSAQVVRAVATKRAGSIIPPDIRQRYTLDSEKIYDLNNDLIQGLAREFYARYPEAEARARAIHYYCASTIKYTQEGHWESAPQVLARREGSCSEFSYLFSALCRATGLPTRFAAGSRLRKALPYDDNQGHRWCEVYFPGRGWVPYDPTLDSKDLSQLRYVGRFFQPSLITFHGGGDSNLLGNAYNSTDSSSARLKHTRTFYWRSQYGSSVSSY